MNRSDLPRIAARGRFAGELIEAEGGDVWGNTRDWQSPLTSGGGPAGKGGHSDPTAVAGVALVLGEDEVARLHERYQQALELYMKAADDIVALHQLVQPVDPARIERGRVNTVPVCVACGDPAPTPRRGLDDKCYKRWQRAGCPTLSDFIRQQRADVA